MASIIWRKLFLITAFAHLTLEASPFGGYSSTEDKDNSTTDKNPLYRDQSTFYSTFFTSHDHGNNSKTNDVSFVIDSSNAHNGTETKYIKISSSIEIPETESVKIILDALKVVWEAALTSIKRGFMPSMERVRRDTAAAESTKGSYINYFCLVKYFFGFMSVYVGFILDWIIDLIGALMGRQQCSEKVACRTGRLAQDKLPGSQMLVMMIETFVPPGLVQWFSILKSGVMSAFDACDASFLCDFNEA